VLKGRQLMTLDAQQILRESGHWAERLAGA
jgi:hypothetical protein